MARCSECGRRSLYCTKGDKRLRGDKKHPLCFRCRKALVESTKEKYARHQQVRAAAPGAAEADL